MKIYKKLLALILTTALIAGQLMWPIEAYAEEAEEQQTTEEQGTQEEGSEIEINNEAEVNNEIESTANTGENTVEIKEPEASPSSLPSASPSPLPEPEGTQAGGEELKEASPAAMISGNAVAVTEIVNEINSTVVNSEVKQQTLNIFLADEVDLTDSEGLEELLKEILSINQEAAEINVRLTEVDNYSYVENEVTSVANTGGNSLMAENEGIIQTGNAYSIVSLVNQVNTTIINSMIHLVTINIFGEVRGDIVLPDLRGRGEEEDCCREEIKIDNQAEIQNEIVSVANTGGNSLMAEGEGEIETGEAESVVNVVNVVNRSLINTAFSYLKINNLGEWLGSFLGFAKGDQRENGCPDCQGDVGINNQAYVSNQIESVANTGGNTLEAESGKIKTGSAYSSVSLFNLVNTNIIDSVGWLGFINIFGSLGGDIGSESLFAKEETGSNEPEQPSFQEESSQEEEKVREEGGLLEVSQTNNVGDYVWPGDTVTFTVEVKNPGTGTVYDTELEIFLMKEGVFMGSAGIIKLGNIGAKRKMTVTTGLVLSETAEGGEYTAVAEARGKVGPNDEEVLALAESYFSIAGLNPIIGSLGDLVPPAQAEEPGQVLGAASEGLGEIAGLTTAEKLTRLFWAMLAVYLLAQMIDKRKRLAVVLVRPKEFMLSKAVALRSLLFSILALLRSP